MEELKTLKDLRYDRDGRGGINYKADGSDICSESLKQEAIKWIKALGLPHTQIQDNQVKTQMYQLTQERTTKNELIQWIKNFFNITEEELK